MGKKPAYFVSDDDSKCSEMYSMLRGPDAFECCLTEPEDRTWHRDGYHVVKRLNEQHSENAALRLQVETMREKLGELHRKYSVLCKPQDDFASMPIGGHTAHRVAMAELVRELAALAQPEKETPNA